MKDKVEHCIGSGVKDSLLLSEIGDAESVDQGRNNVVARGEDARYFASADSASIFTQGDIAPPVETVFNLPVFSDEVKQTRRLASFSERLVMP